MHGTDKDRDIGAARAGRWKHVSSDRPVRSNSVGGRAPAMQHVGVSRVRRVSLMLRGSRGAA